MKTAVCILFIRIREMLVGLAIHEIINSSNPRGFTY